MPLSANWTNTCLAKVELKYYKKKVPNFAIHNNVILGLVSGRQAVAN
jgi:hypothetical protein